jgi:phosphatidylglycerol:prolipoprotein diacylglycerol transferase
MYPALPFGPFTLPTGPIFALLAGYFGLEAAARFGRRFGLRSDDVWNAGLLGVLAGFIVARLWNVIQFWYVYAAEPLLIFSLRPSGFALLPGLVGTALAVYAYLLYRALDPLRMAAALGVGALITAGILAVGDYLTGAVTGLPSDLPWALPYFGEMQHPVGFYRAVGFAVALVLVWLLTDPARPGRTLLLVGLSFGVVHLLADGFLANAETIGPFRTTQFWGLVAAVGCAAGLAWSARATPTAAPVETVTLSG